MVPEGGQLPDLRFTSGSKDETRSQCLGDNKVFDEQPGAAVGEGEEACGRDGEPLNFLPAGVGRLAPSTCGAALALSLKGCPADLASHSPEKSPGEREDAATAVTQCPARRMRMLPLQQAQLRSSGFPFLPPL